GVVVVVDAVGVERADARPIAGELDVVADAEIAEARIVAAHHRVDDAVGRGVAHQHRAAAVVDALHDPAQLARGVRGARIAVVVAVVRSVVVVVVAERVVIAAEADGEADVEMREEAEARFGDEERIRRADDPDAIAAVPALVTGDAPFVEERASAIEGAAAVGRASTIEGAVVAEAVRAPTIEGAVLEAAIVVAEAAVTFEAAIVAAIVASIIAAAAIEAAVIAAAAIEAAVTFEAAVVAP